MDDSDNKELEAPTEPVVHVKDGGIRGWLQVLGAFFIFFNVWGLTFAYGSFQSFYALEYLPASGASAISWIGTVQSFLLIVCGVISGPLFDLGYYRAMIVVGSTLSVLGIMMLSLAHEYYAIFLSHGICMGIGFGLLYIPSVALVSRRFARRRAVALGISTSGAPAGGIIYTLMFEQLIPKVKFAWTVRVLGFVMLFLFVGAAFLLLWKTDTTHQAQGQPRQKTKLLDLRALRDPPFWSFTASNFLLYLGYMTPFYYIPTYAETKLHTSRSLGLYILIISQAASIIGRVATTTVAHRYGSMIPWIFCGMVSGILCLAWISVHSLVQFILYSAFYGGISGALVPLPPSVFPHVCPDPAALGTWLGMAQSISSISTLIGPPIAGAGARCPVPDTVKRGSRAIVIPGKITRSARSPSVVEIDEQLRLQQQYPPYSYG
ncbi:major facilitator superfamily domain-containing protein [Aspergillus ambiguus]|uniref:major facilitator superfamily domain-containing protein n=1 Tax=Aspergillus ambiguus TaxID=176160 RepID=UPI003CCCF343